MTFDLHIHSCLSPCAALEMSPGEIVRRVQAAGLDGMALTDHQSARNAPALAVCAARAGLSCLFGLEVCTAEEVHTLALFDSPEQAAEMTEWVYAALPKRVNDPDVFGDQPVVTWDEDIVEMEWRILAMACRRTIPETAEKCHALGGLYLAAHVDRATFSVFSQLGGIPVAQDGAPLFDALELSRTADEALWRERTAPYALTRSSDAHHLDDVARVWSEAPLAAFTVAELKAAFRARTVACSPRLTRY